MATSQDTTACTLDAPHNSQCELPPLQPPPVAPELVLLQGTTTADAQPWRQTGTHTHGVELLGIGLLLGIAIGVIFMLLFRK